MRHVLPSGSVKESLIALLKVDSTNVAYLTVVIVKTMLVHFARLANALLKDGERVSLHETITFLPNFSKYSPTVGP